MWCVYITSYAGQCGKWVSGIKSDRCDRHKGKVEKIKKERQVKFRGDSKFQKEHGMFTSK